MKAKRFLTIYAALCVVGMGVLLAGCGHGSSNGSDEAQKQFLAERGSGTPGVISDTIGTGGQKGLPPGAFGTVEKVEGNKIYAKNPMTGQRVTFQLAANAKIEKQKEIAASEIKAGDPVFAAGSKNGEAIEAEMVQVGGMDEMPGAGIISMGDTGEPGEPGGSGGPIQVPLTGTPGVHGDRGGSGDQMAPIGSEGQGSTMPDNPVSGTVDKVDADNLTIKANDGTTTTLRLTPKTRITGQAEVSLADVKVGNDVMASGAQRGGTFEATHVQIVEGEQFTKP